MKNIFKLLGIIGMVFLIVFFFATCNNGGGGQQTYYTVTYNGNGNTGGTAPIDYRQYNSYTGVTVLGNTGSLVKSGYTFLGWNTQADGNGISYLPGYMFPIKTNTILYANWMEEASGLSLFVGVVNITGDTYSLPDVLDGYTVQPEATIEVNNVGTSPTNVLVIELQGSEKDNFELSSSILSSIGVSGSSNFTIKAKTGLGVGFYIAIVKVSGIDCQASFIVRLTVRLIDAVKINAGNFTMGSPDTEVGRGSNETEHSVILTKGFYMGKYEVTQDQYQKVMGTNPSNFTSNPDSGEIQEKRPVEMVSWYDALVFCNKLSIKEGLTPVYSINGKTDPDEWGTVPTVSSATWNGVEPNWNANGYRMPTEAELEYACRAGTSNPYNPVWDGTTVANAPGWYVDNSESKTHEVGKKPPNGWGLYDMHGNVRELCWDSYGGNYPIGSQIDPIGAESNAYRVMRGGWCNNIARHLRSASRDYDSKWYRSNSIGFRVVRR